jgi:molybdopterin-binding protein
LTSPTRIQQQTTIRCDSLAGIDESPCRADGEAKLPQNVRHVEFELSSAWLAAAVRVSPSLLQHLSAGRQPQWDEGASVGRSRDALMGRSTQPKGLTLMKISARNVLSGKVIALTKGATTAHVKIEIAAGAVVTASITNEAVDALGLAVGKKASAVIKASDVMVAID